MNILVVGWGLAQTGISPVGIGIGLVTQQLVKLKPVGLELAVRLELELVIPESIRLESVMLELFRLELVMDESVRLECIPPESALVTVVPESMSLMLESVSSSQCPVADEMNYLNVLISAQ